MNLTPSNLSLSDTPASKLHILLEHNAQGNAIDTILELPNCQAEAPNREQALENLKEKIAVRLETAEIFTLEIQSSASTKNTKP